MYFMICIRVVSHRVWHVARLGKLLNRVSSGLKLKMRYKEETCLQKNIVTLPTTRG
jgi:hypothetical protein